MDEAEIFLEALKRTSSDARQAFLDQACEGRYDLRRSVELLLQAHAKAGGFLAPPPSPAVATLDQALKDFPGSVIGPYKRIEQIGEGGMGTVWLAQQTQPVKRLVAVKLIKAGQETKHVTARFEVERQALALMDHPTSRKCWMRAQPTSPNGGLATASRTNPNARIGIADGRISSWSW
jgi:serine/threonine protein kinase